MSAWELISAPMTYAVNGTQYVFTVSRLRRLSWIWHTSDETGMEVPRPTTSIADILNWMAISLYLKPHLLHSMSTRLQ